MTGIEIAGSVSLGTAAAIVGWIFRSGRLAERVQEAQNRAKRDSDGLGKLVREEKARNQRRWLFAIADSVESAETPEMRARLANRIRHEAYRTGANE